MRKLLIFAVIALVVYGISQSPKTWANATQNLGGHIAEAADGIGTFFTELVK
jgi:hypothetical protein